MTLLNHIGVFLIIYLIWTLIAIFEQKTRPKSEYIWLSFGAAMFFYLVFEAFYWTFKIFF